MRAVSFTRFTDESLSLYYPPRRAALDDAGRSARSCASSPKIGLASIKRTSDLNPAAIARWMDAHPERTPVTTKALLALLSSPLLRGPSRRVMSNSRPV